MLYDVEYGDRKETVGRLLSGFLGTGLMYAYEPGILPLLWGAGYFLAHGLHWGLLTHFLTLPRDALGAHRRNIAAASYMVVVIAFLWMPVYWATQHSEIQIYVGGVLIAATVVYQIRRADRILWLVWAQVVTFATAILVILAGHLDHFDTPVEWTGAVAVTLIGYVYVARSMLYAHGARLRMEQAAQRSAQDQKMSAIGRLAGGVAHDFNNMLTVIKGNLELYHLMQSSAEQRAVVDEAYTAAERGEQVVHHLLVYARKAPTHPRVVEVNAAVRGVLTLARPLISDATRVETQLSEAPLFVEVDESQLTTALLNVIKNATDAMPNGGALRVAVTAVAGRRRDAVEITVEDTGGGILAENLTRVAEPFFTTKPVGQGVGLGLSMVAGFAQAAAGELRITNAGQGAHIQLCLPASPPPEPQTKTPPP